MIKNFIASIYENGWLFNQTFSPELYLNGAYVSLLIAALIPCLVSLAIFYFIVKYPFCKWVHWFMAYFVGITVSGVLTYNILANFLAIYIVEPETYPSINGFILNMIIFNCIISLLVGFVATIVFKQAPLPQRNIPWKK
jgi:hypothetical protein